MADMKERYSLQGFMNEGIFFVASTVVLLTITGVVLATAFYAAEGL
jgi:hypothetical protein